MEQLYPNSFHEAAGGALIALGCICGLASQIPAIRDHSMRLMGLVFVLSMATLANHWITYFAGLFVVATVVTELEFLQTLAAIIRGNNDYFKFATEQLSRAKQEEKIAQDQEILRSKAEITEGADKTKEADKPKSGKRTARVDFLPSVRAIMQIESRALDETEKYLEAPIERYVKVRKGRKGIALDGLIESPVNDVYSDRIVEVKYLGRRYSANRLRLLVLMAEKTVEQYSEITRRNAKVHLVVVIEGDVARFEKLEPEFKQMIDASRVAVGYTMLTTEGLGLPEIDIEEGD